VRFGPVQSVGSMGSHVIFRCAGQMGSIMVHNTGIGEMEGHNAHTLISYANFYYAYNQVPIIEIIANWCTC